MSDLLETAAAVYVYDKVFRPIMRNVDVVPLVWGGTKIWVWLVLTSYAVSSLRSGDTLSTALAVVWLALAAFLPLRRVALWLTRPRAQEPTLVATESERWTGWTEYRQP